MTMLETRPARGRFLAGLILGLAVGAIAAGAGTAWYLARQAAHSWIDAGTMWVLEPSQAAAPALPQTFAIPAKAYDYGATTKALAATVTGQPAIVRVELGAVSGSVGVSLDRPDGSALVSKERPVTAKDSGATLYFRVTPWQGPVSLLVRNYAAEGQPGSIAVKAVTYVPEAGLSKGQLSDINKAGVN
jgi:hypothetical protein